MDRSKRSARLSAGILLFREREGGLEVLLGEVALLCLGELQRRKHQRPGIGELVPDGIEMREYLSRGHRSPPVRTGERAPRAAMRDRIHVPAVMGTRAKVDNISR